MKWEKINGSTERMVVPGGWVVLHKSFISTYYPLEGRTVTLPKCESMVFVHDHNHEWKLDKEDTQ